MAELDDTELQGTFAGNRLKPYIAQRPSVAREDIEPERALSDRESLVEDDDSDEIAPEKPSAYDPEVAARNRSLVRSQQHYSLWAEDRAQISAADILEGRRLAVVIPPRRH